MTAPTPQDDDFVDFTWWDHALHKQHTRVRRSLLGHPSSCNAKGDPRYLGASVALTRCGHVSTGPMNIRGYDVHLAPRGIAWCEGAAHAHAPHAWGRVCSGPDDLATLRASWLALGRCWGIGVEGTEPLEPGTRFGPAWPSLHVYRVTAPARWMGKRGALGVGTGGITPSFSARNVPRAGFIRHLVPLGLMLHGSLVCGVFPDEVSLGQRRALLRETWTAVLEAWLFDGRSVDRAGLFRSCRPREDTGVSDARRTPHGVQHGRAGMGVRVGRRGCTMAKKSGEDTPPKMTSAEVLALPEERRMEVIAGRMEEKAAPDNQHSYTQVQLGGRLGQSFGRKGGGGPGGWWILSEVDLELGPEDLVRPDLAGWRREKLTKLPPGRPMRVVPDWVCELVSPSNARRDRVEKMRLYHRVGIGHYWLLEPEAATLTVLQHDSAGYRVIQVAAGTERICAAPFEQLEFSVAELLGEEPDS